MAKYKCGYSAGRWHYEYSYSKIKKSDNQKERAEKKHASSAAQKKLNDNKSRIALTGIIAANFLDVESYFVTLTFSEENYISFDYQSKTRKEIERQANLYRKKLAYRVKKYGGELKTVWCIGMGEKGRLHIHFLVTGAELRQIKDCWEFGNVDAHSLRTDTTWLSDRSWFNEKKIVNPVQIAKYMMQNGNQGKPLGKHPWHASKNCTKAKKEKSILIPDNEPTEAPDGAIELNKEKTDTLYSKYSFVEYIMPAKPQHRKKRTQPRPRKYRG